jgi:hypothetical protein
MAIASATEWFYIFFIQWKTIIVDYSGGLQRAQIDN